jgi:hypothetical protein
MNSRGRSGTGAFGKFDYRAQPDDQAADEGDRTLTYLSVRIHEPAGATWLIRLYSLTEEAKVKPA